MCISYPVPSQLILGPHRSPSTDWLGRIFCRGAKVFPGIRGENKHSRVRKQILKHRTPNNKANLHSAVFVWNVAASETPARHMPLAASPPTSWRPSGASLPTLHLSCAGLSLTVMWPFLSSGATSETPSRHVCRQKRTKINNPDSRHDACACQSKGTHSEDKRYGQGSELDSLIISSDSRIALSGNLSPRGKKEKRREFKNKGEEKQCFKSTGVKVTILR